jgi:hypothetical protein
MMRRTLFAFILLTSFCVSSLFGQAKVGTAGVQFLKIGVSARAVGMGDAFTAIANDASALYYNPAGLIQLKKPEAIASHINFPAGVAYEYLGFVYPMPKQNSVIGAFVGGLWTDDMIETTPALPYGTGRTFTASDFVAGVSFGRRLTDKFTVGGSVKFINENLADEAAYGWTADVGTYYQTGWKKVTLAMLVSNFGPDMNFVNGPFPMPMNFKFGTSIVPYENKTNQVVVDAEFCHPNDNLEMVSVGVEYGYKGLVFLRCGKKMNGWKRDKWREYVGNEQGKDPYIEYPIINENGFISFDGFSLGGGVKFQNIGLSVDYSYATYGYFGAIHRFTLGYIFKNLSF